jgi:hypothetical protein
LIQISGLWQRLTGLRDRHENFVIHRRKLQWNRLQGFLERRFVSILRFPFDIRWINQVIASFYHVFVQPEQTAGFNFVWNEF